MDGSLYLRIRGRIQGPFEEEKLRSLVRRGQLSRMHQLSTDGTNWQRADEFPELFNVPKSSSSANTSSSSDGNAPANSTGQDTSASSESESSWHYAIGDKKFGPVDLETLRKLVGAGQLGPTSQVWSKGMHSWATVESIAGLLPNQDPDKSSPAIDTNANPRDNHNLERNQEATDYSRDFIRSLSDAKGWVLFIAWSGFGIAVLLLVQGFLAIAFGLSKHLTPPVTFGLTYILCASVTIVGAVYLLNYHRYISRFVNSREQQFLDSAMRTLNNLWVYIGIILIVLYVLGIGVAVWVIPMVWELVSANQV